jgi:inosine-uridine nucleoside N-ribohydrolase
MVDSRWPEMSESRRVERLEPPPGAVRIVLDTDTYNEVDDQFAVAHAVLSPEKIDLQAIYAAPFHNNRSTGPGDGMERSYDEILRLLDKLGVDPDGKVYKGSTSYLPADGEPVDSAAARDLVAKATASTDGPLYVVAIGAITNVASALLIEPSLVERIVVVWLGGQPWHWATAREFNLAQDVPAVRAVFDSGVPLVQIPCACGADQLKTTLAELERCIGGASQIADYLVEIVRGYSDDHFAWSKVIWDISAIAWLLEPSWVPTNLIHSPILTDEVTWSHDPDRHLIRQATPVKRDPIFRDLFTKLRSAGR